MEEVFITLGTLLTTRIIPCMHHKKLILQRKNKEIKQVFGYRMEMTSSTFSETRTSPLSKVNTPI